jgi:hypothetical protein
VSPTSLQTPALALPALVALVALVALPGALLLGCGVDERVAPLTSAPPVDAGSDAPDPLPEVGPWKRSVLHRNPVGGPSGNLLLDGDFESSTLSYVGAQTAWRVFSGNGSAALEAKTETGGLCRSGLRCAVLAPNTLHLIRGTAARDAGNVASIWAKLPAGSLSCKVVKPILIRIDDFTAHTILSGDKAPDEEGYCQYSTRISEKADALGIYLENTLEPGTVALLDGAFLGADDGTIHPYAAEFWAPPPELAARLEAVRETMKRSALPPRRGVVVGP